MINDFYNFKIFATEKSSLFSGSSSTFHPVRSFSISQLPLSDNIRLFNYFLKHKHTEIPLEVIMEKEVKIEKEVEKEVKVEVEKIVRRPGYWVLVLASILSFMLGHTISDRQREAYRESVIEESTRQ